jgi:hypothetical protein
VAVSPCYVGARAVDLLEREALSEEKDTLVLVEIVDVQVAHAQSFFSSGSTLRPPLSVGTSSRVNSEREMRRA